MVICRQINIVYLVLQKNKTFRKCTKCCAVATQLRPEIFKSMLRHYMHFHSLYPCYGVALNLQTSAILSTMLHNVTSLTLVISFSCSSAELAQSTFAAMKIQNIQLNLSTTHYSKTKRYIYYNVFFFLLMANIKTCDDQWVCSNRIGVKLPLTSTRGSRNCTCCWISEFTRLVCHGLQPP